MSEKTFDKIEFMEMLIQLFSEHYGMSDVQACRYMGRHQGLSLAEKHYGALHTLPFQDMVEFETNVCKNHGGMLQ